MAKIPAETSEIAPTQAIMICTDSPKNGNTRMPKNTPAATIVAA